MPSLCFKRSSLSVRVEFFMSGFTAKIAVIHLHSHMQTFPYTHPCHLLVVTLNANGGDRWRQARLVER